jgi:hypothetical protein
MKMAALLDTASCILVEEEQCFAGAYCLHHQREFKSSLNSGLITTVLFRIVKLSKHYINM